MSSSSSSNKHPIPHINVLNLFVILSVVSLLFPLLLPLPELLSAWLPLLFLIYMSWHRHFASNMHKRNYVSLMRLYIFLFTILLYNMVLYAWLTRFLPIDHRTRSYILMYNHMILIGSLCFPFPRKYSLLHKIQSWLIFIIYDIPSLFIVLLYRYISWPLNSPFTSITLPPCPTADQSLISTTSRCKTHIILGAMPLAQDVAYMLRFNVKGVVNLCREWSGPHALYQQHNIQQLRLNVVDSQQPTIENIENAIQFIRSITKNNNNSDNNSSKQQRVFIHCKCGMGRSVIVVLCYLIAEYSLDPVAAVIHLNRLRPEVSRSIVHSRVVKEFVQKLQQQQQLDKVKAS